MNSALPIPIQIIILKYIIVDVTETICEELEFETLKWLDYMLKPSKTIYINRKHITDPNNFYERHTIKKAYIGLWLIDKYNISKSESMFLYQEYALSGNLNGVKMLKYKFNLTKVDCLGKYGYIYCSCWIEKHFNILKWLDEEFKLTKEEIEILKRDHSGGRSTKIEDPFIY